MGDPSVSKVIELGVKAEYKDIMKGNHMHFIADI